MLLFVDIKIGFQGSFPNDISPTDISSIELSPTECSQLSHLKLLYMPTGLKNQDQLSKNEMNLRTKIYEIPHKSSAEHICPSNLQQSTLQHGIKQIKKFQACYLVSVRVVEILSFFCCFFQAKYVLIKLKVRIFWWNKFFVSFYCDSVQQKHCICESCPFMCLFF